MNNNMKEQTHEEGIETVAELLAHALELESESAQRYTQLADSMEIHHNEAVEQLFRRLADLSEEHAHQVEARAVGIQLPEIAPWDFKWHCPGSPETDCMEHRVDYLMTSRDALKLAYHNETRGRDFYRHVAAGSPDAEVRRIAGEMADEEADHVELLKQWLAKERHRVEAVPEDLDPPNTPE